MANCDFFPDAGGIRGGVVRPADVDLHYITSVRKLGIGGEAQNSQPFRDLELTFWPEPLAAEMRARGKQLLQWLRRELAAKYGELFMKALAVKATVRKHVNVLQHILGHFKEKLDAQEKAELLGVIGDYHQGLTPLIVPLTLIKHYVQVFDVGYIREQVYLNPHPKELMLRNHV